MPTETKSTSKKPQTHSYQKVIVRPGTYRVPAKKNDPKGFQDASGKWVREEVFSNDRLTKIAETAREMLDGGFKIPAPFAHKDKSGLRPNPFSSAGTDGASLDALTQKPIAWDSSINGGHWRDLQYVEDCSVINPEFKAGPGLVGTVDTFGDPNDLNTPAGKVSRTVQETSILVLPNYKPPMGDRVYEDYIAHIAMPVHAVEPGQDNFAEAAQMSDESEDELLVVSMSDLVTSQSGADATEVDDPEMVEVIGFLQQLKIDLPPETTRDNLVSVLRILLRQKIADQKDTTSQNPLTQPPAGSANKPAPVAMSDSNKTADALLLREQNRVKDNLRSRVRRLAARGGNMDKELIDSLNADIDAIQMSADDLGDDLNFPVSIAEKQIAVLERTIVPMTGSLIDGELELQMSAPDGSVQHAPPVEGPAELDDDYAAAIAARVF